MSITRTNLNDIIDEIYNGNVEAGWYTDPKTGERIERNVPEMLMLMVSEISEAMEGVRKNLKDDKLPQFSMFSAEMADVFIRWADLSGYMKSKGYDTMEDMDNIIYEKRMFNKTRADHQISNRVKEGGKAF